MHADTPGRYTVKVEKDGVQHGPTYTIGVENALEALFAALSVAKASPEEYVNAPRCDCGGRELGCCSADCPKAPAQGSMLDAAKLSLDEAERLEAEAYKEAYDDPDAEICPRQAMRDELLLANAQASIAVAEALSNNSSSTSPDELFRRAGFDVEKMRKAASTPSFPSFYCVQPGCTTCPRSGTDH